MWPMVRRATNALLIALVFSSWPALAQERMRQVGPGEGLLLVHPDWSLTNEGKQRLDATLERQVRELEQLRAENASLRTTLVEWQARPALTLSGALLLVGGGFVLGALVAIPVAMAARR